ncbi:MAG: protein kinase domain-containing protein [Pyrinomonadaceae bacterium]
MTPERWQKIESIFQTAIEMPPSQRARFVGESCGGDADLELAVNKLLRDLDAAEDFIESPIWTDSSLLNTSAKRLISNSLDDADKAAASEYAGRQIGPYRLERELGRGGMGAVYLAERTDGEFRQRVAVKLIKRGMDSDYIIRRFRHERQILASFEHPFIARLLDGGTTSDGVPYFVMEYIEGDTLYNFCDGRRLSLRERLKLFQKICSAIEYAHERQIVHRDIKPSNILINGSSTPKLLDFGIAKILDPDLIHESLNPTASMLRMMTPDYASPEQVRGEEVTPLSDIYSLGILLYELLSGHRPYNFSGRALHEISRVVCEVMPLPPSSVIRRDADLLPKYPAAKLNFLDARGATEAEIERTLRSGLDDIVMKAVAKDPAERYGSAKDLSQDISRFLKGEKVAAPRYSVRVRTEPDLFPQLPENSKAIAVLPFKFINLGDADDSEHKFLGLGLADALITRLSKVRRFVVRPTRSILPYGDGPVDPIAAGRELGVDYILDGSIKLAGRRLRTSIQLLSVHDNAAVWATSVDETISDVLTLEETVANKVVEVLLPQLTGSELIEFSKRGTNVPEAFEHYLRGRYHFNTFTEDGLANAFVSFHSAIAADPNYALAYAGIADYYNWLGIIGVLPPQECFQPAIEAATRAVEIDDTLSEAHASLGFSLHAGNYDWSRAEHHLRRALELNPTNANAYVWYSIVLFTEGRFDEGHSFALRGVELDPLTPFNHHNVAWGFYFARRYDDAEVRYRQVTVDFPTYNLGYYGLSKVHRIQGKAAYALAENATANELTGKSIFTQLSHVECLAAAGRTDEAREALAGLERLAEERYVSPYQLALAYCYLKDRDKALECLERARELHEPWLNWMGVEPAFDILRSSERFDRLLESVGYRLFFSNFAVGSADLRTVAIDRPDAAGSGRIHDVTTLVIDEAHQTDDGARSKSPAVWAPRKYLAAAAAALLLVALTVALIHYYHPFGDGAPTSQSPVFESPTLVVLPFAASGGDRGPIGVGLADALSNKLGGVKSINVISASTGRALAESSDPRAALQELGIPFVIRGRVEGTGEKISVAAELVNTAAGGTVWSQQFSTRDQDLFEIQTAIAEAVLRSLRVSPLPMERQQLARRYSDNPEAYQSYLIGRSLMADRSRNNLKSAIDAFQRSLDADPDFALSHVGLADANILLNTYDVFAAAEVYDRAREAANAALKIDDDLAEAHASLGYIKFFHDRDRAGAELEFRRAIQLNPSYPQAHHWFALALSYMRRPVEAASEAEIAQRLDPLSPAIKSATGIVHYMNGRYAEAIAECERALALSPNFVPAIKVERWAYDALGDKQHALEAFHREIKAAGGSLDDPGWKVIELQVNAPADRAAARAAIDKVANDPSIRAHERGFAFEIALAYNAIGETALALDHLERAEATHAHSFNLIDVEPRLANLRGEPRFQRLLTLLHQPLAVPDGKRG